MFHEIPFDSEKRKTLKLLGSSILTLLAASCLPADSPDLGELTSKEIENIASNMLLQKDLPEIYNSGRLLLLNQQGKPSLSLENPFFTDDRISVKKPSTNIKTGVEVPAGSTIIPDMTSRFIVPTKDKESKDLLVQSAKNMIFQQIQMDTTYSSPLVQDFFFAWQMEKPSAYDEISEYMITNYSNFVMPDDPVNKKSLQVYHIVTATFPEPATNRRVPIQVLGDFWASYKLVPDFLKAKAENKFNNEELKKLDFLNNASLDFFRFRTLSIASGGEIVWTEDKKLLQNSWLVSALTNFRPRVVR